MVGRAAVGQKRGQSQHLAGIGRPCRTADSAAGFRRDIDKIVARPGRRAFGKVEAKTEIVQNGNLEADEQLAGVTRIVQVFKNDIEGFIKMRMRITLRQKPQQLESSRSTNRQVLSVFPDCRSPTPF